METGAAVADGTHIEWSEATWNFITGCTKVSAGCDHCYIERTPPFRMAHRRFDQPGVGGTTGLKLHSERLHLPRKWRKPRRIFVNSLADLFHDQVPDAFIAEAWSVMARCPQHTFQVLTKRAGRMRSLLRRPSFRDNLAHWGAPWPLPNVWLGVSVENQDWARIRIDALVDTPAAVRWVSCEPLLGAVDMKPWLGKTVTGIGRQGQAGLEAIEVADGIDWVVVGGESGPGARPMHPDWARRLRDQCAAANVPFFFKQWGEWQDGSSGSRVGDRDHVIVADGRHEPWLGHTKDGGQPATPLALARSRSEPGTHRAAVISRVGKKAAGRLLDGELHDAYPAVTQ